MLYRIPMANIIGPQGSGIYSAAFNVYNIALILSSYGMPMAVSKLVSARLTTNQHRNVMQVALRALVVALITGGIAAYKSAYLASALKKQHADVHVVMTAHATEFISPLTFETLTNNRCTVEMFDRHFEYDVKHISLAKAADLMIVAPATANFIAKAANGIADAH